MKPRMPFLMGIPVVGFIALLTLMPVWGQSYSPARIVRLSFVEGDVTVQRPDVQAWAEAPVNTPLQQGFKVSTGENSFAEMQFENGGTVRLGERGLLDLTSWGSAPNGGKINQVDLRQGYATFHPLPSQHRGISASGHTVWHAYRPRGNPIPCGFGPRPGAHGSLHGAVEVQSNLGAMTIEKDSVLIMQPGATEPTVVSQGITKDDWDQWVDRPRKSEAEMPATGPSRECYTDDDSEATYGWNDLSQYGTWSDVPGEGYGWTPTCGRFGWAPYSNGRSGAGTPAGAIPGLALNRGDGCPIIMAGGISSREGVGYGSRAVSESGPRARLRGFTDRIGSGGLPAHSEKTATAPAGTLRRRSREHLNLPPRGRLTSNLMLGVNPDHGDEGEGRRESPRRLRPSCQARRCHCPPRGARAFEGTLCALRPEPGIPATAMSSPGSRNPSTTSHNPAIVYDSQKGNYVNGYRATPGTADRLPAQLNGSGVPTAPACESRSGPTCACRGRQPNLAAAENQGIPQPHPGG